MPGVRPVSSAWTCTPSATSVNVTVPLTLLPSVGCTAAIAFNGADGFSVVAWARAIPDVSDKNISVINETGNKFIQGLRRTELFQPYCCGLIHQILARSSGDPALAEFG